MSASAAERPERICPSCDCAQTDHDTLVQIVNTLYNPRLSREQVWSRLGKLLEDAGLAPQWQTAEEMEP